MSITKEFAEHLLIEMDCASRPGEKICDEVQVEKGKIVAWGFTCDKEECNCCGGWWQGNKNRGINYRIAQLQKAAQ